MDTFEKPRERYEVFQKSSIYKSSIHMENKVNLDMEQQESQALILKGIAASQGQAEGVVKIVWTIKDNAKFNEGDVLVTKMTEPSMVPVMIKAAAIITDIGGLTSHAAIVSREMGTPCVVATKDATTVLKDGQKVRVDGTKGEVYLI